MQTKIPTTITIYVHDHEKRVLNDKDFRTEMICRAADLQSDTNCLSDWLSDVKNLSAGDIFNLTKDERDNLWQEYDEYCAEKAEEELLDEWTEHTLRLN